jgi:hypothetical protein
MRTYNQVQALDLVIDRSAIRDRANEARRGGPPLAAPRGAASAGAVHVGAAAEVIVCCSLV